MKLQYHAIIPIPSMPIVCQRYDITHEGLARMIIESLEGNDYQVMRRVQELPCVTDPDMAHHVLNAMNIALGEFLDFMPEMGLGQHIRDIYLIAAHPLTVHVGFSICDDE